MNPSNIVELVTYVSFTWPSFRLPENKAELRVLVDVWGNHLGDLDPTAVRAAVDAYAVEGSQWAPAPGQIRRRVAEHTGAGAAPDTDAAWAEVSNAIARVGWTVALGNRIEWSHPAVAAAVGALGWDELCGSTNVVADRAHFARFYADTRERAVRAAAMPPSVAALMAGSVKRLEVES